MKLLIVNPVFYVYGGAERLIVKLANYLTDKGHSVSLLTTTILPNIKKEFKETRIIETPDLQSMAATTQSIIHNYDVINVHNDPSQMMVFPRQRPTVWMCNEPPIQVLKGGELDAINKLAVQKHIKRVVVADEFNQRRFKELYDMDSTIIHYGVDSSLFTQNYDRQRVIDKYGLGDFNILQVGMFTFTKNQQKTVQIFKKLKKLIPEAKLVLAGQNEGPYYDQVSRQIAQLGLRRDVIVTGEIPQSEICDLYHACKVLLAPIHSQGGWLSVFEAIVSGCTVVVSPELTASSIIKEHNLGIVTDNYVEEIINIYLSPRSNIGAPQWVKENLSWDKFCGGMLQVFEEVSP